MNDTVYYIRFVNGDELLTKIAASVPNQFTLQDPMFIENIQDDNGAMIYLSRYNSFGTFDDLVMIPAGQIQSRQVANPTVTKYYEMMLEYCRDYMDEKFIMGIEACVKHLAKKIKLINDLKSGKVVVVGGSSDEEDEDDDNDEFLTDEVDPKKFH